MRGFIKALQQNSSRCPIVFALLLVFLFLPSDGEVVRGVETEDFDFDGLPGSMHEFKFYLTGSQEQCFFQELATGTALYVYFDVLKGGDQKIDFFVKEANGPYRDRQLTTSSGHYELEKTSKRVVMEVCIENSYGYGTKLVHLSLVSMVVDDWLHYAEELNQDNVVAENFTTSLISVQESIAAMVTSQLEARFHVIKDWYTVTGNNYYVLVWSLLQNVLIVAASLTQVYVVRRLFRYHNVTPTQKPRA